MDATALKQLKGLESLSGGNLSPELQKRIKRISFGALAVAIPLIVLDLMVLKGDHVFRKSHVMFRDSDTVTVQFPIEEEGEKYTVRFNTGKYEIALGWTLVDAEGRAVDEDSELFRHDGARRFSFRAETTGEYTLTVTRERESGGLMKTRDRDHVTIEVVVRDRQILAPIFEW